MFVDKETLFLPLGRHMPSSPVDSNTKQLGQVWLFPPDNYSLRQIASPLDVGITTQKL